MCHRTKANTHFSGDSFRDLSWKTSTSGGSTFHSSAPLLTDMVQLRNLYWPLIDGSLMLNCFVFWSLPMKSNSLCGALVILVMLRSTWSHVELFAIPQRSIFRIYRCSVSASMSRTCNSTCLPRLQKYLSAAWGQSMRLDYMHQSI